MSVPTKIEYRVIPVTRYTVTRYEEHGGNAGSVSEKGEYGNAEIAYEVGYALAKAEHQQMGWAPGDERIQYPQHIVNDYAAPPSRAGQMAELSAACAGVAVAHPTL